MRRFLTLTILLLMVPVVRGQSVQLVPAFPQLSFNKPVDLQNAGDGSNRLFVVEQPGTIRVFANDSATTSSTLFLDLTTKVFYQSGSELGLLGLAFHPSFPDSPYCFVNFTADNSPRTVIARYTLSSSDSNVAMINSELILLEIGQPYNNHNAGQLAFGPDGFLYIGTGDGGSGGDPNNVAQNRADLLGKMLRIDVDHPTGGYAYGIPADNPYKGNQSGFREEIYSYGLRNPWRFSFDPVTNDLWCADVGQSAREEINLIRKGENYGWRIMEGALCHNPSSGCDTTGLTLPVWDYPRSVGGSITGGYVYRGARVPSLVGRYVFGDFVSGFIGALSVDSLGASVTTLDTLPQFRLTSFGLDENQELYACLHDGTILRFEPVVVTSTDVIALPPGTISLQQNYPNPFNATTVIRFQLDEASLVSLTVCDALGRTIATLMEQELGPGTHGTTWNAGDTASGLYILRLTARSATGVSSAQRRMVLLR